MFTRQTTLFFDHVCSQDVKQDQERQSTNYRGMGAPETLSAQTAHLNSCQHTLFCIKLDQHQEDLNCKEI